MKIILILLLLLFILFQNTDTFNNTTDFTVISNTCVGYMILQKYNKKYNNPFIGSLVIDDNDYIKLSTNFIEYINHEPTIFIPNKNTKYYNHNLVKIPYPIILLKDIKIHCVHEDNDEITLNKFNRRIKRLRHIINNKIFITMSFSQFLNKHDDYQLLIDKFLEKSNNKNIIKLFIGPPQYYKKEYGNNYMIINEWTTFNYNRNESNIFLSNDEELCVNKIKQLVDSFL